MNEAPTLEDIAEAVAIVKSELHTVSESLTPWLSKPNLEQKQRDFLILVHAAINSFDQITQGVIGTPKGPTHPYGKPTCF